MRISVWSLAAPNQRRSPELARDLLRRAVASHAGRVLPVRHQPGRAPTADGLAVSLSRTDGVAMCVVADCEAVGIDLERLRSWRELADMASLIDHAVPGDASDLLAVWTRKEALSKALGTGLPDDVRTLWTPQGSPEIGTWIRRDGWLWVGCPCEEGCVASLVLKQAGPDDRGPCEVTEAKHGEPGARAWTIGLPT